MKPAPFLLAAFVSTVLVGSTLVNSVLASDTIRLPIMDRDGESLVKRDADITDLVSDVGFEGKIFKVVEGSGSMPICLTAAAASGCSPASDIVRLRAATVYFHMTKARSWYLAKPAFQVEPFVTSLNEKVTVRVNQELPFSQAIHFETTGRKVYNGARTIGPSRDWEKDDDTEAWGYETWFYTPKRETNNSTGAMVGRMVNSPDFKDPLRDNLLYGDFLDLSRDAMDGHIDPVVHLISVAFTLGTVEIIPGIVGGLGKLLKQAARLDAAMIPEIAYHEYTHTVLAPVFNTLKSSALNEGYANYFAYQISGLKNLAAHVGGKISKGNAPKKGSMKTRYTFEEDVSVNAARHSFTYSVLVDLEKALGAEGPAIMIAALETMDENTRLKGEIEVILDNKPSEASSLEDNIRKAIRKVIPSVAGKSNSYQEGKMLAVRNALRVRGL